MEPLRTGRDQYLKIQKNSYPGKSDSTSARGDDTKLYLPVSFRKAIKSTTGKRKCEPEVTGTGSAAYCQQRKTKILLKFLKIKSNS